LNPSPAAVLHERPANTERSNQLLGTRRGRFLARCFKGKTLQKKRSKQSRDLFFVPLPARSLSVGQASRLSPSSKYFAHRSVVLRHTGNSDAHGGNFKVRDRRDACPTAWLWIYRSAFVQLHAGAVHPLDFFLPDGLERSGGTGAEAQWLFLPEPDTTTGFDRNPGNMNRLYSCFLDSSFRINSNHEDSLRWRITSSQPQSSFHAFDTNSLPPHVCGSCRVLEKMPPLIS